MAVLLVLALIAVPALEIYVAVQIWHLIGWWTLALLLAGSGLGAYLVKREGLRTWAALRAAVEDRRVPDREVLDAGLVLTGGLLMVLPGLVTDVVGFLLLAPFLRPVSRRALRWGVGRGVSRRVGVVPGQSWQVSRYLRGGPGGAGGSGGAAGHGGPGGSGEPDRGQPPVIEGEVVSGDAGPGDSGGRPRRGH
ncbi:FxsA family protein [Actinopolymorpha sp. NPDC004070]|uniref:FxsA family protein n=1 Tax=Actinopolymorpha sp. NPDC004070 TaxID=3154548 RepID=UPI0033BBF11B